jgi:NTE family protein
MPSVGGTTRRPRVALVLGSGGIVGGAYHAGVLKALHDTWGIDARSVDLIVGTSAGSIAGSLTAAGLHPNDLFRRETGKPLSPAGNALLTRGRRQRGARPVTRSAFGGPAAPEAVLNALAHPRRVSAGSVAAALMPRGVARTDHVAGMIDGLFGDRWPDRPRLRFCAVELHTARRVVFGPEGDIDDLDGRALQVAAKPAQAVAASCAVPSVFEPVTIGGREYLDGGVHSADNLDLVGTTPFDLIVVSSPMASQKPLSGDLPLVALRELSRFQTIRERRSLPRGCRVEILRPTPEDLDAMGSNMLDPRRRPAVAFQAHASASAQLSRRPHPTP